MTERIYLDHAATTPLHPEARAAMEPYLHDAFGNPSSLHADGQRVRHALDDARDTVAEALGADAAEVTFTSGGTESDNAALVGLMLAHRSRGNHLIVSQIEHEAVLNAARFLETLGFSVTFLPVDKLGLVAPEQLAAAITDQTVLVSVMHANNEVGTIQPIRVIADIAHARGVLVHTDAVQSFGLLNVHVRELDVDALTISGHKIGGPKGAGALYVRAGPAIVGLAAATRLRLVERNSLATRLTNLRELLIEKLSTQIPNLALNGHPTERLPNNVNISLPGRDAESLLLALDMAGISASSGSACTSGSIEPSHVLTAMSLPPWRVNSALRLTLGQTTTEDDVCCTANILGKIIKKRNGT
jgi:cysteine desulfurase